MIKYNNGYFEATKSPRLVYDLVMIIRGVREVLAMEGLTEDEITDILAWTYVAGHMSEEAFLELKENLIPEGVGKWREILS